MLRPLSPDDSTHVSLLRRLRRHPEADTWEEFHARYGLLILTYCRRVGLAPQDCEDLVQEVFQALLRRLPGFRYDRARGAFRAYLWRVVRNQAQALRRRRARDPLPLHPEAGDFLAGPGNPDAVWEEEWRRYHLRRAYERLERELTALQGRIFRLSALERRPVQEVARECGTTTSMVYKVRSTCMSRLKALVAQQVAEEG